MSFSYTSRFVLAAALDTFTKLIQSPPGQLAAGGVLAGIVWKCFERVETVLTGDTKLEIAVWLLGFQTTNHIRAWPLAFEAIFGRLFGRDSQNIEWWELIARSWLFSTIGLGLIFFCYSVFSISTEGIRKALIYPLSDSDALANVWLIFGSTVPTIASVICTKHLLRWIIYFKRKLLFASILVLAQIAFSLYSGVGTIIGVTASVRHFFPFTNLADPMSVLVVSELGNPIKMLSALRHKGMPVEFVYPSLLVPVFSILFIGSGFLLKAARRLDVGFGWFSRKCDIENKPLSSIGLVAGALVAISYWLAVIVNRLLK